MAARAHGAGCAAAPTGAGRQQGSASGDIGRSYRSTTDEQVPDGGGGSGARGAPDTVSLCSFCTLAVMLSLPLVLCITRQGL